MGYGTASLSILSAAYLVHPACSLLYVILLFRNESPVQPLGSNDLVSENKQKNIEGGPAGKTSNSNFPPLSPVHS